jgi:pSer/pThr/pTyr-binding forkhead associated (FHA) protein
VGQRWLIVGPTGAFELERGGELRIGRHPTNDLVVAEPHVSRLHALLRWPGRAPAPVLEDLGSANGTLLDGRRVAGLTPLRAERATIDVGPVALTARLVPGAAGEPVPAHLEEARVELDLRTIRALTNASPGEYHRPPCAAGSPSPPRSPS